MCFLMDSYDKLDQLQVRDAAAFFVLVDSISCMTFDAPKVKEVVDALARMTLESRDVLSDDFIERYTDYRVGADCLSKVMNYYKDYFSKLDSLEKWKDFFSSSRPENQYEFVRTALLDFYADAAPGIFGEQGLKAIFGPIYQAREEQDPEEVEYSSGDEESQV